MATSPDPSLSSGPRALTLILGEEHELIGRVLTPLARLGEQVASGASYDPRQAREFLRFLNEFCDLRHHEKEEGLLFPWLEARGLPRASGPLGVLGQEHEVSRDLRLELSLIADELLVAPRAVAPRRRFRELVLRYVELLTAHIEKEEQVLFPLADRFAVQTGAELLAEDGPSARDHAWVERLESMAATWPDAKLSFLGLGTPYGFERLCEAALSSP